MPRGKFKGKPITQVPRAYLQWMIDKHVLLADLADQELRRRDAASNKGELDVGRNDDDEDPERDTD